MHDLQIIRGLQRDDENQFCISGQRRQGERVRYGLRDLPQVWREVLHRRAVAIHGRETKAVHLPHVSAGLLLEFAQVIDDLSTLAIATIEIVVWNVFVKIIVGVNDHQSHHA